MTTPMYYNQQQLHKQDESPLALVHLEAPESEKAQDYEAIRVEVVGPVKTSTGEDQFGIYSTIVIPPSTATAVSYVQVLARDVLRQYAYIMAIDAPVVLTTAFEMVQSLNNVAVTSVTGSNPTPSQPAVPASTVAQQNTNSYPVQVVISLNGGTISAVFVNGIQVGSAAGTYDVPAYGAISITWATTAPTWVWSDANAAPVTTTIASIPSGLYLPALTWTQPIRHNDPIWAANTSLTSACRVAVAVERGREP